MSIFSCCALPSWAALALPAAVPSENQAAASVEAPAAALAEEAATAPAEVPAAEPGKDPTAPLRIRVVLTRVQILLPAPPSGLTGLDAIIAAAMQDPRFDLVSPDDIVTLLGFESQKQMMGCGGDSSACLAEIGGALGARYLVYSQVSRIGSSWTLSLNLLDGERTRTIGRVAETCEGEDEVVGIAALAGRRLKGQLLEALGLGKATKIERTASRVVGRPNSARWWGVGIGAFLAAGGLATTLEAFIEEAGATSNPGSVSGARSKQFPAQKGLGIGLLGLGAVGALGSYYLWPKVYSHAPSLALGIGPQRLAFTLEFRLP